LLTDRQTDTADRQGQKHVPPPLSEVMRAILCEWPKMSVFVKCYMPIGIRRLGGDFIFCIDHSTKTPPI